MPINRTSILHTCGHEVLHALPARAEERRQREAWLRGRPCPACWRGAERADAEKLRESWSLPALEGGDDERAWADVIRMKVIAHNREYHDRVVQEQNFSADEADLSEGVRAAADAALRRLQNESDAAWWIANRFEAMNFVKQEILTAITPLLEARRNPK